MFGGNKNMFVAQKCYLWILFSCTFYCAYFSPYFGAKTENPLLFCVPKGTKLTLRLFFEGIDLSDFFLVLLHQFYCGLSQPTSEE